MNNSNNNNKIAVFTIKWTILIIIITLLFASFFSCKDINLSNTINTSNNATNSFEHSFQQDNNDEYLNNDKIKELKKLNITTTIPPQAEFLEAIGKDLVAVNILVTSGADPHTFELKPSQLKNISNSSAYFELGSGIEFEISWLDKIKKLNPELKFFNCSENITIINNDPHIWLSLKNAVAITDNIYKGLVLLDPKNSNYYLENKNKYQNQLLELDVTASNLFKNLKNNKFIVDHSAWGYFAADYGLEQIPIEEHGKEPTIKDIENIIKIAKENNIKVIFVSPQFNTKNAEIIANEISGSLVFIDPLEKSYIENMKKVIKAFESILG